MEGATSAQVHSGQLPSTEDTEGRGEGTELVVNQRVGQSGPTEPTNVVMLDAARETFTVVPPVRAPTFARFSLAEVR